MRKYFDHIYMTDPYQRQKSLHDLLTWDNVLWLALMSGVLGAVGYTYFFRAVMAEIVKIPMGTNAYIEICAGSRGCTIRNVVDDKGGNYVEIASLPALQMVIHELTLIKNKFLKK